MTDLGYAKGIICEILHCAPSELSSRCTEVTDEELLIEYHNRKVERGQSSLGDEQH